MRPASKSKVSSSDSPEKKLDVPVLLQRRQQFVEEDGRVTFVLLEFVISLCRNQKSIDNDNTCLGVAVLVDVGPVGGPLHRLPLLLRRLILRLLLRPPQDLLEGAVAMDSFIEVAALLALFGTAAHAALPLGDEVLSPLAVFDD